MEALAGQGDYVEAGQFTLDPERARAKLRDYQLDEPAAYVLLLVEAAWLAGLGGLRSRISFQHGATTCAQFSGLGFDANELSNVLGAVFRSTQALEGEALARARALQMLGLAVNAALALEPSGVLVAHTDAQGHTVSSTFRLGAPASSTRTQGEPPPGGPHTRFELRGGSLDILRPRRERELLLERARYASFPVQIDGETINLGYRAALEIDPHHRPTLVEVATESPRRIIGGAVRLARDTPAQLFIITRGVLAEVLELDRPKPGFVAAVEVDLRKDLSQRKLVRNSKFRALMAAVARANEALPEPPGPAPELLAAQLDPGATSENIEAYGNAMIIVLALTAAVGGIMAAIIYLSPTPSPLEAGSRWTGQLSCGLLDYDAVLQVSDSDPTRATLSLTYGRLFHAVQAMHVEADSDSDWLFPITFERWIKPPDRAFDPVEFDAVLDTDDRPYISGLDPNDSCFLIILTQ